MSDVTNNIPKGTLTKEQTIRYLMEIDNRFCIEPCVMRNAIYSACHYLDEELAKEPQECKWYKGINSVETCWGDINIKTFNKFKRQGARFCPYCGRKIKEV